MYGKYITAGLSSEVLITLLREIIQLTIPEKVLDGLNEINSFGGTYLKGTIVITLQYFDNALTCCRMNSPVTGLEVSGKHSEISTTVIYFSIIFFAIIKYPGEENFSFIDGNLFSDNFFRNEFILNL